MRTSRLEAFSDGVLAIIITVMVLELKRPEDASLSSLVDTTGSALLSYLLSFVYVGIYWTNHHHMFQLTDRVTGGILWANLALLFSLSLFPFTTDWTDTTHYARVPVVVYGLNLLAAALAYWVLELTIIRSQGPNSALRNAVGWDRKGLISLAGLFAGCAAALFGSDRGSGRIGVWIAIACFVAVAAMWIIPDRRIEAIVRAHPEPDADEER